MQAAVRRGDLILARSLANPPDGAAVLLCHADSPAVAEAFAQAAPYVIQGIVNQWWVRTWDRVVGKNSANPLSD